VTDARISHTGPDSYNKISYGNEYTCEVENNNDVNVVNKNDQDARTGDAAVGSGWGAYAPETWQAEGHSYEEWQKAVSAYMSEYEGKWGSHGAGGGNTYGGDASAGDATNINDTRTNVHIGNSDACARYGTGYKDHGASDQKPGHVLGGSHDYKTAAKADAGKGGASHHKAHGYGTAGSDKDAAGHGAHDGGAKYPSVNKGGHQQSHPGSKGTSDACECAGGYEAAISQTGPGSYNKTLYADTNKTSVTHNNNITVTNSSQQNALSGDAVSSGNTTAGTGGSGGAYNDNHAGTGANLHN